MMEDTKARTGGLLGRVRQYHETTSWKFGIVTCINILNIQISIG